MKKKILVVMLFVLMLCGCATKEQKAFKNDYESLNGKTNASGKIHRTIKIDSDNPFEKITGEELVKKFENKETFYVYFGDEMCPWCRSVIEKFIEHAKKNNVTKVYYVDIWDKDGNEVFRDKYIVNDNKELEQVNEGTEAYFKLMEYFDNVLSDYNITVGEEKVYANEKRIYAPNFMYVEKGVSIKKVDGIPAELTDPRGELTTQVLKEEDRIFNEFFTN